MKLIITVKGMTCPSCENRVERALKNLGGIEMAKADFNSNRVVLDIDEKFDGDKDDILEAIRAALEEIGYSYSGINRTGEKDFSIWQWFGIITTVALAFLLISRTGIMNALPVLSDNMGYGLLFLIGLMTSVHCIGMCGGINLSVSLSGLNKDNDSVGLKRLLPGLLYNGGRVLSYTMVGAAAGALGSVVSLTGKAQGVIVGMAGFIMVLMGLSMTGLVPGLNRFIPRLPRGLTNGLSKAGEGKGPLIVGFLNGFMPCGPLQSVQIYALGTGSALAGALSMFLFSAGTVPLMLGFGSLGSLLPSRYHGRIMKISAILVLFLGGGMMLRGLNLNGIDFAGQRTFSNTDNVRIAEIDGDRQYVRTIMKGDEYEPFIVQAGIPVVWTIYADESELNGCNNPLTVPEYDIRFTMEPGENIIEFTPPSEADVITYTCWMGMITSGIKVVEDLSSVDEATLGDTASLSGASSGSCGSGSESSGCGGCGTGGVPGASSDLSDLYADFLPQIESGPIGRAETIESRTTIYVEVREDGFHPPVIVLPRGHEIEWEFSGIDLTEENYRLYFPAHGNRGLELVEGSNVIRLIPQDDFAYYSWKNHYGGYVRVIDSLDDGEDDEAIRKRVEEFNESTFRLINPPGE